MSTATPCTITPEELLEHWQGHRRLTRKLIEVYPEDKLFTYSIGGMRPFSDLVLEMLGMTLPGAKGVLTGEWTYLDEKAGEVTTRQDLLDRWDKTTRELDELWPRVPVARFHENDRAFGQWEGPVHSFIFYWIDNEIHHRGQAYVYLRSLGIEPPPFWDRG